MVLLEIVLIILAIAGGGLLLLAVFVSIAEGLGLVKKPRKYDDYLDLPPLPTPPDKVDEWYRDMSSGRHARGRTKRTRAEKGKDQ